MKKNTTYLTILIATIAIVLIGFLLPVPTIKSFVLSTYKVSLTPWIAVSAAACAFIFLNNKHYWLIIIACGLICGILVLLLNNNSISAYKVITRTTAFTYICYILNYIKFLIGK